MDAQRWSRIKPLLERAIDLSDDELAAFVASLPAEDADLQGDLRGLLAHPSKGASPLFGAMTTFGESWLRAVGAAQPIETPTHRIGAIIGGYRLERVIGLGGMGTVYLGQRADGAFDQRVAIKVVDAVGWRHDALARFDRERGILARLRHPYIASLFDAGETDDGLPYITMEYIEGADIRQCFRAAMPELESRLELLANVGRALAFAHQNLVVHRDIKPSNVLISALGFPKLVDFGIAKLIDDAIGSEETVARVGPMTPEFAAPEQFRGEPVTVATDIFQFGTLCYRLLTGRRPYREDPMDHAAWSRAVTEQNPLPLRQGTAEDFADAWPGAANPERIGKKLGGDLDAILRKALEKRPRDRYASMDAMVDDLENFVAKRPVVARRAGTAYFAWRWVSRRPYVSAGAAMALILLVIMTLFALLQARSANLQATRARHEASRADQTSEFLTSLFRVSDPGVNRGERLNANEILERGADRIAKEFASQPAERARLLEAIGEVYVSLGDWARAEISLTEAVRVLRETPSADRVEFGHALRILGANIDNQGGNPRAALAYLDEARDVLSAEHSTRAQDELARVYAYVSTIHADLGQFDTALVEIDRAAALAPHGGASDEVSVAMIASNKGRLLVTVGRPREALSLFTEAISIYLRVLGPDHFRTLRAQSSLALAKSDSGDFDGARALLLNVIAMQKRVLGADSKEVAHSLLLLGGAEMDWNFLEDAAQHLDAANQLWARIGNTDIRGRAQTLRALGRLSLLRGDAAAALRSFDDALAAQSASPSDEPDTAFTRSCRAEALLALGRTDEAVEEGEHALRDAKLRMPTTSANMPRVLAAAGAARIASGSVASGRALVYEALRLGRENLHGPERTAFEQHVLAVAPALGPP